MSFIISHDKQNSSKKIDWMMNKFVQRNFLNQICKDIFHYEEKRNAHLSWEYCMTIMAITIQVAFCITWFMKCSPTSILISNVVFHIYHYTISNIITRYHTPISCKSNKTMKRYFDKWTSHLKLSGRWTKHIQCVLIYIKMHSFVWVYG